MPKLNEVRSNLGACSTVVRELLQSEGIDLNEDKRLATALYYGLMTDTNNFTEIFHPLDKDLRDDAVFERSMVTRFRNANLSLKELEIAGNALLGYGMIFTIFLLWKRVFLKSCMKYFSIIEKYILE